jgi:MlaC protein
VTGEQPAAAGVMVRSQIIGANGEPVTVDYMMRRNGNACLISDIYLDGAISEVATRRSEFAAILKNEGIDDTGQGGRGREKSRGRHPKVARDSRSRGRYPEVGRHPKVDRGSRMTRRETPLKQVRHQAGGNPYSGKFPGASEGEGICKNAPEFRGV